MMRDFIKGNCGKVWKTQAWTGTHRYGVGLSMFINEGDFDGNFP